MKLNRKGYMLAEIIISFAIALAIVYYLFNLTFKFKDTSEDIYNSAIYNSEKINITKNIMNDIERTKVTGYSTCTGNCVLITAGTEQKKLEVIKSGNKTIIRYGKIVSNNYVKTDVSYYEKEINSTLKVGEISLTRQSNYFSIRIPITSIYDDNNYDVIILSQLNS